MRKLPISLWVVFLVIFSGCATFGKVKQEKLIPKTQDKTLLPFGETLSVSIGFKPLEDKRPEREVSYMTSVKEKASSQILNALKEIQLFSQINSPPSSDDKIIISGEIRKFSWHTYDTMVSYLPGLNVLNIFGLPSTRTQGEVEIYLELKDVELNKTIFSFTEQYEKQSRYNIYNFKSSKADDDLAYCFNIVLNKIRQRFFYKKDIILDAVKSKIPKKSEVRREQDVPEPLSQEAKSE